MSRRNLNGECSAGIGTFVVINPEGWFLTAWHIFEQFHAMQGQVADHLTRSTRADKIRNSGATPKEVQKQLRELGQSGPDTTVNCSAWWSYDNAVAVDVRGIPAIDLAIGRLEPFDPSSIALYPEIKDPSKNFDRGTSLCKFGFPFHSVQPTWDNNSFSLPAGALPMPLFPIEGIFTRKALIPTPAGTPPYPLSFVETSSPGLRGQSGGPTCDQQGAIWAIQSRTAHLELGFDPVVVGKNGLREHQFLNVGMGVSAETIVGMLTEHGVKFTLSQH